MALFGKLFHLGLNSIVEKTGIQSDTLMSTYHIIYGKAGGSIIIALYRQIQKNQCAMFDFLNINCDLVFLNYLKVHSHA